MNALGAMETLGGLALLILVVLGSALLGFLLFISPLMVWLNLRRLRLALHADLTALRESLDRLAGAPALPEAAAPEAEPEAAPADAGAASEGGADQIGFSCPECGKFFEGPASLAGSTYTCPECRIDFHIH